MTHDDFVVFAPRLNCKELHFNVASPRGGTTIVDNVDASLVVHIQRCEVVIDGRESVQTHYDPGEFVNPCEYHIAEVGRG